MKQSRDIYASIGFAASYFADNTHQAVCLRSSEIPGLNILCNIHLGPSYMRTNRLNDCGQRSQRRGEFYVYETRQVTGPWLVK
jgi:hypothetical protein